jgi:outer membrane protein TolC
MTKIRLAIMIIILIFTPAPCRAEGEMSLVDSIEIALRNNLNHKYETLTYEIGRFEARNIKAELYPRVYFRSTNLNYEKYLKNSHYYTVGLSQPVYTGGRLTNLLRAGLKREKSKYYNMMDSEINLEKKVTQEYLRYIMNRKLLKIRTRATRKAKKQLEFVESEHKAGRRGKEAVLRWQVLINNYEEDSIRRKDEVDNTQVRFNSLLERNLSDEVRLDPYGSEAFDIDYQRENDLQKRYKVDEIVAMILAYTMEMSPPVLKRDIEISAARYDLEASRGNMYPRVSLAYDYGWLTGNTVDFNNSWTVGVAASYPIFDQSNREQVEIYRGKLKQAQILKDIYIRDVKSQIKNLYNSQMSSLERVILKRKQFFQSKQYLDQLTEKYRQGKATDIDLVDAFNSYYDNQFAQVSALYNYYIERENMQALMGYSDYHSSPTLLEFTEMKARGDQKPSPETVAQRADVFAAIDRGDLERIKEMTGRDPSLLTFKGKEEWTPLHYAAFRGSLPITRYLIEKGADVNVKGVNSITPIYVATARGHIEVVRFLLEKKADPNIPGDSGRRTPLIRACEKGRIEIAKLLIQNGADVEAKSVNGWTPLHNAVEGGYVDLVKFLIEKGANVNAKTNIGMTPLLIALSECHEITASILEQNGAKENP